MVYPKTARENKMLIQQNTGWTCKRTTPAPRIERNKDKMLPLPVVQDQVYRR